MFRNGSESKESSILKKHKIVDFKKNNLKKFGVEYAPPLFHNMGNHIPHLVHIIKYLSIYDVRDLNSTRPIRLKYVIVDSLDSDTYANNGLFISRKYSELTPLTSQEFAKIPAYCQKKYGSYIDLIEINGRKCPYFFIPKTNNLVIYDPDSKFPIGKVTLLTHDLLAKGRSVIAAGDLLIKHGKIMTADNFSGHYQPFGRGLPTYVETVLKNFGFEEADGCFNKKIAQELWMNNPVRRSNVDYRGSSTEQVAKKIFTNARITAPTPVMGQFCIVKNISSIEYVTSESAKPILLPYKRQIILDCKEPKLIFGKWFKGKAIFEFTYGKSLPDIQILEGGICSAPNVTKLPQLSNKGPVYASSSSEFKVASKNVNRAAWVLAAAAEVYNTYQSDPNKDKSHAFVQGTIAAYMKWGVYGTATSIYPPLGLMLLGANIAAHMPQEKVEAEIKKQLQINNNLAANNVAIPFADEYMLLWSLAKPMRKLMNEIDKKSENIANSSAGKKVVDFLRPTVDVVCDKVKMIADWTIAAHSGVSVDDEQQSVQNNDEVDVEITTKATATTSTTTATSTSTEHPQSPHYSNDTPTRRIDPKDKPKGIGKISGEFYQPTPGSVGCRVTSTNNAININASVSIQTDGIDELVTEVLNRVLGQKNIADEDCEIIFGTEYKYKVVHTGRKKCEVLVKDKETGRKDSAHFVLIKFWYKDPKNKNIINSSISRAISKLVNKNVSAKIANLFDRYKQCGGNPNEAQNILTELEKYDAIQDVKLFIAFEKTKIEMLGIYNNLNVALSHNKKSYYQEAMLSPVLAASDLRVQLDSEVEQVCVSATQADNQVIATAAKQSIGAVKLENRNNVNIFFEFPHPFKIDSCRRNKDALKAKLKFFNNRPLDEIDPENVSAFNKLDAERKWSTEKWAKRRENSEGERTANINKLKSVLADTALLEKDARLCQEARKATNLVLLTQCYHGISDNFGGKNIILGYILKYLTSSFDSDFTKGVLEAQVLASSSSVPLMLQDLGKKVVAMKANLDKETGNKIKAEVDTLTKEYEKSALLACISAHQSSCDFIKARELCESPFFTTDEQAELKEKIIKHRCEVAQKVIVQQIECVSQVVTLANNALSFFGACTQPNKQTYAPTPDLSRVESVERLIWNQASSSLFHSTGQNTKKLLPSKIHSFKF